MIYLLKEFPAHGEDCKGKMSDINDSSFIAPSKIRSEIERLSKECLAFNSESNNTEIKKNRLTAKATLANIVVICSFDESSNNRNSNNGIDNLVAELAVSHPSRFFLIHIAQNQKDKIKSQVKRRLIENKFEKNIYSEEIHLYVKPDSISLTKNILLSNFIPDIEIIFLELFSGEVKNYRNIIFDTFKDITNQYISLEPLSSIEDTEKKTNSKKLSPSFKSLLLAQLGRWRNIIADQFETKEAQNLVDKITDIYVNYSEEPKSEFDSANLPTEALTLSSWILYCLKLKAEKIISDLSNELIIECSSKSNKKLKLHLKKSNLKGFINISQVKFEMNITSKTNFSSSCLFNSETNTIEISSSGSGEADISEDLSKENLSSTVCEFYYRRCLIKKEKISDTIIKLIRSDDQDNIYDKYQGLINLILPTN